jgi:hypothetical protein
VGSSHKVIVVVGNEVEFGVWRSVSGVGIPGDSTGLEGWSVSHCGT